MAFLKNSPIKLGFFMRIAAARRTGYFRFFTLSLFEASVFAERWDVLKEIGPGQYHKQEFPT